MGASYKNNYQQYEYVPFPEIGCGSQFRVFDTHDGRVLKMPLTKIETYNAIVGRRHNMNPLSQKEAASVDVRVHTLINGKGRIPSMIAHPFNDAEDFLQLIGTPKLIVTDNIIPEDSPTKEWGAGRVVYTQEKVAMVGDLLRSLSGTTPLEADDVRKLKNIIELYIQQTYKMWSYGYSDYVFKIGDTGLDAKGKLVLIDIGEYTNDPQFVLKAIADKRWLHSTIASKIDFPQIPRQLYDFYVSTCENALTEETFQKYWRQKHHCSDCIQPGSNVLQAFIAAKASEIDFVDRW